MVGYVEGWRRVGVNDGAGRRGGVQYEALGPDVGSGGKNPPVGEVKALGEGACG